MIDIGTSCLAAPTANARHTGKANVSWLDGHVKSMKVDFSIQKAWKAVLGEEDAINACVRAGIGYITKAPLPPGGSLESERHPGGRDRLFLPA